MSIYEIEKALSELHQEKTDISATYDAQVKDINKKIRSLEAEKTVRIGGFDYDKIKAAAMLLDVEGITSSYYDASCIDDAIKDILEDCPVMKERYFGSKNYSGFTNQREDHKYGYGPKHGSIVCSVGLRNPAKELTAEDKENCLYYLNAIKDKQYRELARKHHD